MIRPFSVSRSFSVRHAGLVPGIHIFVGASKQGVDGRIKHGHDSVEIASYAAAFFGGKRL
jgi:hypothetical protein